VNLGSVQRSPVQLLITNEGLAAALITLSLRADPAALRPVPSTEPPPAPANAPVAPVRPEPVAPQPAATN
jgi:serine/threonine-protein kinase